MFVFPWARETTEEREEFLMRKILVAVLALVLTLSMGSVAFADFAPVNKEDLKVGVVYIGDVSDKGYTYAHHQGILAMQEALGLTDDQIIIKRNVTEDAACETALRELVEQGCQVIFGCSFGYMDYMAELAEEYPEVIFSHCSGYKSNETNFNNYFGRIYEARYLAGIAAGLKTETNHLGYVAAMSLPEVNYSMDAYFMGAKSVNPDVTMTVKYTNTWYDPTLERQAADALLDLGCDVIAQHQDTAMPVIAAEEKGVWACGYNADMSEDAPKAHLVAPIWNWGVYYTEAVQQVIDGTWKPENVLLGMQEGLCALSPISENCAEGTKEKIAEVEEQILSGEFGVFEGPITDNEGNVQVAEGVTLTPEEILQVNWLCEGITVG